MVVTSSIAFAGLRSVRSLTILWLPLHVDGSPTWAELYNDSIVTYRYVLIRICVERLVDIAKDIREIGITLHVQNSSIYPN